LWNTAASGKHDDVKLLAEKTYIITKKAET
jgi:hypothetical protein